MYGQLVECVAEVVAVAVVVVVAAEAAVVQVVEDAVLDVAVVTVVQNKLKKHLSIIQKVHHIRITPPMYA